MFGRGEKYVLPVMDLYPKDVIEEVSDALSGKMPSYISRVPMERLVTISIDKLTLRKNKSNGDIIMVARHDVNSEYVKSWRKGLGRLIVKDFKKDQNYKMYAFVRYTSRDGSKKVAFVRFISRDEVSDTDVEDMKAYGAISGELSSWVEITNPYDENGNALKSKSDAPTYSIEDESYFVVLRVVPYISSMNVEDVLSLTHLIKKSATDGVWGIETDPFDEPSVTHKTRVEEEPEAGDMNPPEDTLF